MRDGDVMVKMPRAMIAKTLRDLPIGGSTWTVPWALCLGAEDECFLNGAYTQCHEPGGTVQMRVTRTDAGYICDVSRCSDHGWHRESSFVGGADPIPVARLIGAVTA